ncbi:hypothetical protein [Bradyrhizobium sp. JYMT SZCCT0428]|uniref:hypothetical protein n=1 Tax=Bradyrhizobium sp. JYMT SZCCT0428 TaxID=2807673 RepID=UPI001BA9287F|nr:hypothetical protein [Bradyrhizobium sp. JYMT SZCCT0428]MBR1157031.1 hypothetical protein [Bradyrhizobium sp. JYMT SZCCT0428]
MSFQLTILKVLAGQRHGRASHLDVAKCVAIPMSSGRDWSDRMKRLAARAPGLSIFSSDYVLRDASGWQITDAGRAFLTSIEVPASGPAPVEIETPHPVAAAAPDFPANVIKISDLAERRRRLAAA